MAAMTRLSLTLDPMGKYSNAFFSETTRRFLKFQPMRTHYGAWKPCWISNQHQKHKSGRGPSSEHCWQVWLKSVQMFHNVFSLAEILKIFLSETTKSIEL
jgi:hypothetical protein